LAALAARAGRAKPAASAAEEEEEAEEASRENTESKSLAFRNYTPADASLEPTTRGDADEEEEPASKRMRRPTDEQQSKRKKGPSALERALARAKADAAAPGQGGPTDVGERDPAAAAAPKKVNADLKKRIQPKLDRLERRTERAIVALLRERLASEAATATATADQEDDDDDDLD
jgi:coiled-coil domain-containing protein 12